MLEIDAEQVLQNVHSGKELPDEQRSAVLRALEQNLEQQQLNADEEYSLISVLLALPEESHRVLLKRYLDIEDPLLVALILEKFCLEWGIGADYHDKILEFLHGTSWDYEQDVQLTAIAVSGALYVTAKGEAQLKDLRPLIAQLCSLFRDESLEYFIRLAAYRGILRAAGVALDEIPSEFAQLTFAPNEAAINWDVIKEMEAQCK